MSDLINRIASFWAIVGGLALTVIVVMVCVSVTGRALIPLGLSAIPGDFEILEAVMGFIVFCFLPYCQLHSGHATVDIFTSLMGKVPNRFIAAFWEINLSLVIILITWRLYDGLLGKMGNGSTSMLLQFPIWWAYMAAMIPALFGVLVALWSVYQKVMGAFAGEDPHTELDFE